jgi:excisionase family DNA binding protein
VNETTQPPFLSFTDLAARLGVSRSTAYSLVRDRVVPVIELHGRLRVPASALARWLDDREREALEAVRDT